MPIGTTQRAKKRNIFYDEFNGTTLRAEWAKTDTENKISVSGGNLVFAGGKATPAWDDPRLTWTKPITAKAGLVAEFQLTFSSFGAANGVEFGFDTTNPVADTLRPAFRITSGGVVVAKRASDGAEVNTPATLTLGVDYRFRIASLGASGIAWLYSADGGATWKILWIDANAMSGTVYLGYDNRDATFTSAYARPTIRPLVAPILSDAFASRTAPGRADTGQPWWLTNALAVPTFASNDYRIPAGGTQTRIVAAGGPGDGIIEADLNFGSAPSTQKLVELALRYRDATNFVVARFNRAAQTITFVRVAVNVSTTIATLSSAGFADNTTYHIRLVCAGSVMKAYQDGVEKLSVSESFLQYAGLVAIFLNDNLATPDMRIDNVQVWGIPRRPILTDTFDKPDGTYTSPAPDAGGAYTPSSDIGMPNGAVISEIIASGRGSLSNNAALSTAIYLYELVAMPAASFVASIIARWDTLTGNLGAQGMMIRRQDDQNFLAVYLNSSNNSIVARKRLAGTFTTISSGSFTPVVNTDALITVIFIGNTLEVYVNGVRIVSTTYSDFTAPGTAGPFQFTFGNGPMHLDDLRIYALTSPIAIHDTFTRADSASTLGSAESPGTPWVTYAQGAGSSVWGITSNKAYQVSVSGAPVFGMAAIQTGFSDVDTSALIAGISGGTIHGLTFRMADNANFISARIEGSPNSDVIVRKTVAGVSTTIATYSPGAGVIADGSSHTLRVRALGTLIQVYLDGTLVLSVSEPDLATAKIHGMFAASGTVGTSRTWDNYEAKEIV